VDDVILFTCSHSTGLVESKRWCQKNQRLFIVHLLEFYWEPQRPIALLSTTAPGLDTKYQDVSKHGISCNTGKTFTEQTSQYWMYLKKNQ